MPQFGGASEKCTVCNKTVYLTEKIVVEDKEDKKTFHKTCLRCTHCKVPLTLGNYASMQGVFYCKPHFKQLFATKGNYDEGFGKDKHSKNWTPQVATAPASFVPVDKDDQSAGGKKETPSAIASKFGKTTQNTEKCHACNKTVYATEKTVIEEKEGKKVYHKTCLKCNHCNVIVTLGNYASMEGVVYCKPHFKQLFAAKGNYDEGFGKEKAASKWEPQTSGAAPNSFVPVDKDDVKQEKKTTPASIASKFNQGSNASEKCGACGKTVYLTEKLVIEDKEDKQTFHKSCLRCAHCQVVLTLGNYAALKGVYYCKPHFKQLFAAKGNYDEGFGKEKHTRKWQEKEDGGDNAEDTQEKEASRNETEDREKEEREDREREETARREKEEREREEREQEEREEEEREANRRREREEREREEREREEREQEEREQEEKEKSERQDREEREREQEEERRLAEEREQAEEREAENRRQEREDAEREEREKEEREEQERQVSI